MAHVKNNHVFYMEKEDGRENEQCNLKINDVFHWVIGLGMIAVLISGLVMDDESNNLLLMRTCRSDF